MKARDLQLIRATLALIWLVTGAQVALYGSAGLDILLGILTLLRPNRRLWQAQAALIVSYSLIIAVYLPDYWLHPFAPILKNFPILLLLSLLVQYEERST